MLLARPGPGHIETLNDTCGFVVNAYRSIQMDPAATAHWCDWPVSEACLHARHAWLLTQRETLTAKLESDPWYYDAQVAGWWIWGACCWIGAGWCSGDGPWQVHDGELRQVGPGGIRHKLPHLGDAGRGIHRKLPHLGDAGRGIQEYLGALATRLRSVRITCGDWARVLGESVTWRHGVTGIFLDPPYPEAEHDFGYVTGGDIWETCWEWAVAHGSHPLLRVVLCGYDDARPLPAGWQRVPWKAQGGYGSQGQGRGRANARREVLYCSPQCRVPDAALPLFAARHQADAGRDGL
jgi:hypothetical protein